MAVIIKRVTLDSTATELFVVRDLGRLAYAPALALQREIHQAVLEGNAPPTLLLVEHDPVITISHHKGASQHLLAAPHRLTELGITVEETDRGGDITYHGPGQLVAYPILRLAPLGLNVGRYMRLLEQIVIDTVAEFGIAGHREEGATGVWMKMRQRPGTPVPGLQNATAVPPAKLCAFGVRIRRNITMHGLALNVDPDLSHFQTIVPCGLAGRSVTSLRELLGDQCPSMQDVKRELVDRFRCQLFSTRR